MFRDANDLQPGETLTADIVIVGAGAAGITIARELIGSGKSVLLLESGGLAFEDVTQALYQGEVSGVGNANLTGCRARTFGGTTHWWAGWCRPLEADDFDARPFIPRSGWPIDMASLLPWYKRAHATVQIGAFDYDAVAIAGRIGEPLLPFRPDRAQTVVYQYSPPTRFSALYGGELEQAGDLTVFFHANLTEVVLSEANDAVAHLACKTLTGVDFTATADQYVLALGGVENPRVLLASRRQVPEGVGNRHDHVGRYFMEHPHYYGGAWLLTDAGAANPIDAYIGQRTAPTVDDEHPDGKNATIGFAFGVPPDVRQTAQVSSLATTLREFDLADEGAAAAIGALPASTVGALVSGQLRLFRVDTRAEQRPIPDSRVFLIDETDALGTPRVHVEWRAEQPDFDAVGHHLKLLGAEFARLGVGRLWTSLDDDGHYVPPSISGGCHHMGTTRMSAAPEDGVVDGDCRVHGLDNLYLAGSSVFTTTGFANPTLTIVALAHRLGAHLQELP